MALPVRITPGQHLHPILRRTLPMELTIQSGLISLPLPSGSSPDSLPFLFTTYRPQIGPRNRVDPCSPFQVFQTLRAPIETLWLNSSYYFCPHLSLLDSSIFFISRHVTIPPGSQASPQNHLPPGKAFTLKPRFLKMLLLSSEPSNLVFHFLLSVCIRKSTLKGTLKRQISGHSETIEYILCLIKTVKWL